MVIEDYADLSDNNQLRDAMCEYVENAQAMKDAEEAKKAASNEILDIAGPVKKFLCGDLKCTIVTTEGTADTIITADMVGQTMSTRAGLHDGNGNMADRLRRRKPPVPDGDRAR